MDRFAEGILTNFTYVNVILSYLVLVEIRVLLLFLDEIQDQSCRAVTGSAGSEVRW